MEIVASNSGHEGEGVCSSNSITEPEDSQAKKQGRETEGSKKRWRRERKEKEGRERKESRRKKRQ